MSAIGQQQTLEINARVGGKINIMLPVKLVSWCCASSVQLRRIIMTLVTFIVIKYSKKIYELHSLLFLKVYMNSGLPGITPRTLETFKAFDISVIRCRVYNFQHAGPRGDCSRAAFT